ncbi:MAG: hypothetical protein ACFCD0_09230 [Gemmataceae bacterium]
MNQEEWFVCRDPDELLETVWPTTSSRKRWLFAWACHRVLGNLHSQQTQQAINQVEEYMVEGKETFAVFSSVGFIFQSLVQSKSELQRMALMALAQMGAGDQDGWHLKTVWHQPGKIMKRHHAMQHSLYDAETLERFFQEPNEQEFPLGKESWQFDKFGFFSDLVREHFRHPSMPVTIDSIHLSEDIHRMATTMYDSRQFDDMPVLADALEEAGYSEPDVLDHCRSGKHHYRGCWVVDLILGKV